MFDTMDALKSHYKSDWHRYNLKRNVAVAGGRERLVRSSHATSRGSGGRHEKEERGWNGGGGHGAPETQGSTSSKGVLRARTIREMGRRAHKETLDKVDGYIKRGEEVPEELLEEISRRRGEAEDDDDVDEYEGEWEEMADDEAQERWRTSNAPRKRRLVARTKWTPKRLLFPWKSSPPVRFDSRTTVMSSSSGKDGKVKASSQRVP